jgi:hypothetical protein
MQTASRQQTVARTLTDFRKDNLSQVHPDFMACIESFATKLQCLIYAQSYKFLTLPRGMPKNCIYLFSENDIPLYVGRTRRLRGRLRGHCASGSKENEASFAFQLARELHGTIEAAYTTEGSRKSLMNDVTFCSHFDSSKDRLRNMDIRWVEEDDPLRQALLEIYVSVVLRTPYNDFDTH